MIYHITTQSEWQQAQTSGTYIPAGFAADGFIHCSDLYQVADTANRFYPAAKDLVVLEIDPTLTGAELVYENLEGGEMLFPHLYGHLPAMAVVGTFIFLQDANEQFILPPSLHPGISAA